jgi:hypothetical protein
MTLEESLATIDKFVHSGWHIDYEIVNQRDNGYGKEVDEGNMPAYTYTPYVVNPKEEDYIEELCASFDTLSSMYEWLAKKLLEIDINS